ncbi:MAG: transporter [Planctomycetota bacterium]
MPTCRLLLRSFPAIWCLACCAAPASGQFLEFLDDFTKPGRQQRDPFEERIETERHDFTQSAVTVGRGIVQIEGGYSYFYKDVEEEIESAHTTPELLLRVGLSEDIEFRVRWNYAWVFVEGEEDSIGSEDLRYSLKLQMTRQQETGLLPTSALEIRGTGPTGGEAFSTGQAEFGLDYIYQWEVAEGVTLAGSTGFGTSGLGDFGLLPEEPADERFNALSQSAVLGMELSEMNTLYTEWYALYSDGLEDEFVVSVFNIGVDHYLTEDFVVDFRAGVGLTEDSDDFFAGVGGGYRF